MAGVVHLGDCVQVLATLPENSVDSICTDPPYNLEFMGKAWDSFGTPGEFQAWCRGWAAECFRVLKPGGHLLAFGGARTGHRLAAGVEDAGFEIRDSIAWVYGSGFPKSMDVSKQIDKMLGAQREVIGSVAARMPQAQATGWGNAGVDTFRDSKRGTVPMELTAPASDAAKRWDGWGTALKPAMEPIIVARKPLGEKTVALNVLTYGVGALNIDASRVPTTDSLGGGGTEPENVGTRTAGWDRPWMKDESALEAAAARSRESVAKSESLGRWPANLLLDQHAAVELDRQAPDAGGAGQASGPSRTDGKGKTAAYGAQNGSPVPAPFHNDTGGASRFFPIFKYEPKAGTDERPVVEHDGKIVMHPTVKPLDLMTWLIRLVTPKGGVVCDPFAGSGTTIEACLKGGWEYIGIEKDPDYHHLINARIARFEDDWTLFEEYA